MIMGSARPFSSTGTALKQSVEKSLAMRDYVLINNDLSLTMTGGFSSLTITIPLFHNYNLSTNLTILWLPCFDIVRCKNFNVFGGLQNPPISTLLSEAGIVLEFPEHHNPHSGSAANGRVAIAAI